MEIDRGPCANGLPARRDVMIAALYLIGVLLTALLPLGGTGFLGRVGSSPLWPILLAIGSLAVAWRRRAPGVVLTVTGGIAAITLLLVGSVGAYLLLFEALWAPVTFGRGHVPRLTTVLGLLLGMLLCALATLGGGVDGLALGLIVVLAVIATPLAWGWEVRRHREARRTAEALARAESQLAAERAERAVDGERRKIAQDLHDVVAGHLSAVSLHSALATSLEDPGARSASLATTRESATAALRDLRSVIDMLTGGETPEAAPATTLSMRRLTARLDLGPGTSNCTVDPRVEDPDQVDAGVRAALLRITAEAVNNAVTHGEPPFMLGVSLTEQEVLLTCVNASGPGGVRMQGAGGGLGIETMRHRASTVGGSVEAGARSDGLWETRARLPRGRRAPRPAGGEVA